MDQAIIALAYENLGVNRWQFDKYKGEKNPACAGLGLMPRVIRLSAQ